MIPKTTKEQGRRKTPGRRLAAILLSALAVSLVVFASDSPFGDTYFAPGNLVVSRSVYDNNPNNVQPGTILPPNCASTQGSCSASGGAPYDGTYPTVWNNDAYDGSFGITSKILLDQITPSGHLINTLEVPNSSQPGITSTSDQMVTSFSSKSEVALNLSTDRKYLTFMGYFAPVDAIDVSNSNTPGAVDPTNPVGVSYYRVVAQVDRNGKFHFTETNAYSGNNGRAAILNDRGTDVFFTAGNAGNGSNPQPVDIILGAGAQIIGALKEAESAQSPGTPTPVGSFNITELGFKADKIGKDDNFRGITIFNNVLYYSKGSGGNGVNTVYFLDTTGAACPNGVGLPPSNAILPISALSYDLATLQKNGLPSNLCILAGFPATPNSSAKSLSYPFGIWFANSDTLYIADEGDGSGGSDLYTHAAAQTTAGLQKWTFNSSTNTWNLAYTLQTGLNLGVPYTVSGYPTGDNPATKLSWSPATDGLRNITGRLNEDGTATIWAVTSTVSGNGDMGADPNKLLVITDQLKNTDPTVAADEKFSTVREAGFGEVLRGVSFTPGT